MQSYKILILHVLIFIFILTFSCNGQKKETQGELYTKGEIVSTLDNKIGHIYQDQKENYWFGSNGNGIFHYDGKNIIQYTLKDGLVDNTIRGIQGDIAGNVYIQTPKGISKYDGITFTTLKPIVASSNEWKLELDDLWFGYNANDLYRYDGDSLFELKLPRKDLEKAFGIDTLTSPFNSNNPYSVYGLDKDKDGNIWIGTFAAGVFRYDGESFLWFDEKELSILPGNIAPGVRSMLQDKDGYFWLSNFKSKYKIEPIILGYEKIKGVEKDKPNYFNSGLRDNNGDLWMTTYGGGVWKYDGDNLFHFPIKRGNTEVLLISIYKDNAGVLWLGTDNAGVYKFNGKTFEKFEPLKKKSNH
jgi:ligand-binding sensor domain-containing protein